MIVLKLTQKLAKHHVTLNINQRDEQSLS